MGTLGRVLTSRPFLGDGGLFGPHESTLLF